MNVERLKQKKLLIILVGMMVVSFLFGILFISVLSEPNQSLIKININSYFEGISKGNFTYLKSLYSVLTGNFILVLFTWIIGISIIGTLIAILVLIYKSFIVGFSFCSILYTYGIKGIFMAIIYILPELINLFIIFVGVYYAVSFSILLFNNLFKRKEFNKKVVVVRYLKVLIISVSGIIISSLISVFLVPNILRLF